LSTSKINELQNKIIQIKKELSEINKEEKPLPEFIDSTNILRSNEYLKKSNEEKSKLLISYEEYTNELENLVSSISKIKGDITNLKSRIKSRNKPKKKVTKKRILKRKSRKRKTKAKPRRSKSRKSRR
jgi:predicted  nucleic acid-binding Zn-ribbon protein